MANTLTYFNMVRFVKQSTEPTEKFVGLLWFDTSSGQLWLYDGSDWVLIG